MHNNVQVQSLELEVQEESFKGMPFVLCSSGNWFKNQGSDFYADFGAVVQKVQKVAPLFGHNMCIFCLFRL